MAAFLFYEVKDGYVLSDDFGSSRAIRNTISNYSFKINADFNKYANGGIIATKDTTQPHRKFDSNQVYYGLKTSILKLTW